MARHKETERKAVQGSTRRRLLDSAVAAFARDGYDGANINDISTAAGFARGTIYNYFPSKQALVLAVLADTGGRHAAYIRDAVLDETDPGQRLSRFFEAGFAVVRASPAESQVMLNALYGPDEAQKKVLYEAYLPLFHLVGQEIVHAGMQTGQFRTVDPQVTANLLMIMYLGTGSRAGESGQTWLTPQAVADFALHALRA